MTTTQTVRGGDRDAGVEDAGTYVRTHVVVTYADADVEAAVDEDGDDVGIALTTMCGEGDGDFLGT